MAEVGVLNLTIRDNSKTAAGGLGQLEGALIKVKNAIGTGLGLSGLNKDLHSFATTMNRQSVTVRMLKTVTDFGNALDKLSKITNAVNFNVEPFKELKTAIGNGLQIKGNPAGQIERIKNAISGEWNSDTAISSMKKLKERADAFAKGNSAQVLNDMAKAMNAYAKAANAVGIIKETPVGQIAEQAREYIDKARNEQKTWAEGGYKGHMPLNLQLFGQKKTDGDIASGVKSGVDNAVKEAIPGLEQVSSKVEEATKGIHEMNSAFNETASNKGDSFKGASAELERYTELLNKAKQDLQFWDSEYAKIQKQIKFNGMTDERSNALKQAENGGMFAIGKMEEYEAAIARIKDQMSSYTSTVEKAAEAEDKLVKARIDSMQKDNQARLESNYESYRELYMSGEGTWKEDVQKMYGFTEKAIEENETYAGALAETMRYVNSELQRFESLTNKSAGPLLRDVIDQNLGIGSTPKSAEESWNSALKNAPETAESVNKATESTEQFKESQRQTSHATTVLTENLKDLDKEVRQKKTDFDEASRGAKGVSRSFSELMFGANGLKGAFSRMFPTISGLIKRFSGLIKYRALRAVLKHITEGFREGTENMYWYSKAIGSDFASNMDSASSALAQMKNSIGAAVAPVIQMLIPYLQQVINGFINLINYVNQFFALIRGQSTWTKALPVAAEAFDKTGKAAKNASDSIKDLLADWDELNIIQNQSGGSKGSAATGDYAKDYLSMFEEVGEFDSTIKKITDFIKDNAGDMLDMVEKAGLALLAWRFSNAFTGALGTLGALATAGLVMKIQWKLTGLLDKQFLKTGEDGWLVAEVIENMVGASFVGMGVGRVLGVTGGMIAVGIDFSVSGGITYGIALANEGNDNAKILKTIGIVKGILGDLFLMAGFTIISGPAGLLLGAATGSIMFGLSAAYTVVAEQVNTAKEIAAAAFTASHKGSISIEEIFNELQTELNKRTSGYGLIINAFSNVSEMKNNLKGAFDEIGQLTNIIRSDEALTQEEAERFKQAWETVFSAFEGITKDSFSTVFEGLNKSLASENKIIRNEAKELRVSLLMIEENMSEASARFKEKMMGLADKVATGTATKEEIDQYLAYVEEMSQATGKTMRTLQETVEEGTRVDFKNKTDIDDFVTKVNDEMVSAIDEINTGEKAALDALNEIRMQQEMLHRVGEIGDAEYNAAMIVFDKTEENIKKAAEDNRKSVKNSVQDAYNTILESAMKGMDEIPLDDKGRVDVLSAYQYMLDYIEPIVAAIIDAGGDVGDDLKKAFQIGVDPSEAINESFSSLLEGKVDTPLLNYLRRRYKLIVDEALDEPVQAEAPDIEIKEGMSHATDLGEIETTVDGIKVEGDWDKLEKEFDDQVREALGTSTLKVGTDVVGIVSDINQMVNSLTRKQSDDMTGMEVAKPTVSFVGAAPYYDEEVNVANTSSTPIFVTPESNQTEVDNTAAGVEKGNASLVDALNTIVGIVRTIQNKEFVVNVSPNSSWGAHAARSGAALGKVTGDMAALIK